MCSGRKLDEDLVKSHLLQVTHFIQINPVLQKLVLIYQKYPPKCKFMNYSRSYYSKSYNSSMTTAIRQMSSLQLSNGAKRLLLATIDKLNLLAEYIELYFNRYNSINTQVLGVRLVRFVLLTLVTITICLKTFHIQSVRQAGRLPVPILQTQTTNH